MSNITLFKSGNVALPDYLRESDEITKALAGSSGGKQISIKGGVWRMIVGGEEIAKNEDRAMNFVVVAANPHINRTYYKGKFEEGKTAEPSCWSEDGLAPSNDVPAGLRQSSKCMNCPQNIEGSGDGKSRACRFSKRLAVTLENDIEGNVYRLQLPAKSVFGKPDGDKMPLQAYAKFLAGHGVPITGVVTEARFDTSEAVPVLRFRAVRPLTRDEWESCKAVAGSDDAKHAVEFKLVVKPKKDEGPGASPYMEQPAKAAPARAQQLEDDEIEQPVKRPSKKAEPAPVTAKSSAADILSSWSDDDDN